MDETPLSRCPRELQHLQSKIQFFASIHYLSRVEAAQVAFLAKNVVAHWIPGSSSCYGRLRTVPEVNPLPRRNPQSLDFHPHLQDLARKRNHR